MKINSLVLATLCFALAGCAVLRDPNALPKRVKLAPERLEVAWRDANVAYRRGEMGKARDLLDQISYSLGPTDPRHNLTLFMLGEAEIALGNQSEGVRHFRQLVNQAPDDSLAPLALLRAGDAYAQMWRKPQLDDTYGMMAQEYYDELINRYPNSMAFSMLFGRIGELHEKFARKGYLNGLFYYRSKAWESATIEFQKVVYQFPRTESAILALGKLVSALKILENDPELQDVCRVIRSEYSQHRQLVEGCPPPKDSLPAE